MNSLDVNKNFVNDSECKLNLTTGGYQTQVMFEQQSFGTYSQDPGFNTTTDYENNVEKPSERAPDLDSMKMFVGQIPKDWNEDDCRKLLEPYGEIYSINILRDKETKKSKGCCFVTYYTRKAALDAQNALHNLKKLPSIASAIESQIKAAGVVLPACSTSIGSSEQVATSGDFLVRHAKDLLVAAAASVLLGSDNQPIGGSKHYGCNLAECLLLRTANKPPTAAAAAPLSCRNHIQMKPADNENKNDRKLFVGKLPKFMKESDVEKVFANYGNVEECIILRDNNGQSKGCAFVTFSTRSNASAAIRALNQTKTLEGCTTPIVVKFADSNSKDSKPKLKTMDSIPTAAAAAAAMNLQQLYQAAAAVSPQSVPQPYVPMVDNAYVNLIKQQQQQHQHQQQQQQLMSLALSQQYLAPEISPYSNLIGAAAAKLPLLSNQILATSSPQLNGNKFISAEQLSISALPTIATLPSPYSATVNPLAVKYSAALAAATGAASVSAKQIEGPEGANLFIYHLPAEYTDADLIALFTPFGNVLSAKVFIDKNSNLSKCFGFVSYDNVDSAQVAIRSMNGFQVLNKRLKVQLKKVRDKPY